jgi:hypothetical protein
MDLAFPPSDRHKTLRLEKNTLRKILSILNMRTRQDRKSSYVYVLQD